MKGKSKWLKSMIRSLCFTWTDKILTVIYIIGHCENENWNYDEIYHSIYIRTVKMLRVTIPKVGEDIKKLHLIYSWWERKMIPPLWKIVWGLFKDETIIGPQITLPGIYPREVKNYVHTNILHWMVDSKCLTPQIWTIRGIIPFSRLVIRSLISTKLHSETFWNEEH